LRRAAQADQRMPLLLLGDCPGHQGRAV
jgi:hypothetical protein